MPIMNESQKAFYDTIQWQNALRPEVGPNWSCKDYRTIERYQGYKRAISVTMDELREKLKNSEFDIPSGTIRRWASEGLISSPEKYQNPNGRGWLYNWPDVCHPEIATVAILKESLRLKMAEIKEARADHTQGVKSDKTLQWGMVKGVFEHTGSKTAAEEVKNMSGWIKYQDVPAVKEYTDFMIRPLQSVFSPENVDRINKGLETLKEQAEKDSTY